MNRVCIFCLIQLASVKILGQDLSLVGKSEPLQISGTVGMQYYSRMGGQRIPSHLPSGTIWQVGLNASLFGWYLPFSVTYSNENFHCHQPFNRFSLQPSWKWIRLYLGDASMSFSPYSLNGHQFTGGGAELEPEGGKWKVSIMGGRLLRKTFPDTIHGISGKRRRMGYGLAGEYREEKFSFGTGIFYASDKKHDELLLPDSLTEAPAENLVLHSKGTANILDNLQIQFEHAVSFLTPDKRSPKLSTGTPLFPMKYHNGSARYNAFKTGISYTSRFGSVGLCAEKVDPGYRTLGMYYHLNDFANYTFQYSSTTMQKKFACSVSSGLQYDNLTHRKSSNSRRLIHNLNLIFSPSEALQINFTYSNFNRYMFLRSVDESLTEPDPWKNADTLHYQQVTGTWSGTFFWQKEDRNGNRHQINVAFNSNNSREQSADSLVNRGVFVTASGGYTIIKHDNDLSSNVVLQYNSSRTGAISSAYLGPAFSLRKSLAEKKLQAYSTVVFNKMWHDAGKKGYVFIGRGGLSFRQKNHTADMSFGMICRKTVDRNKKKEFVMDFSYRYSFSGKCFSPLIHRTEL